MQHSIRLRYLFLLIVNIVWLPVWVVGAIHERESRVFTSSDGRKIEAKVEGYNPHTEMASLRLASGKKHEIPLSRFSVEDQDYLIEWRNTYEKSFVRVEFFTHRIDSGRIVFMLDRSGSMRGDRWDKMIRNMIQVIDRMDEATDFNIILFGSTSEVFKADLVTADAAMKEEARTWLIGSSPNGGTNLHSAVKAAAAMKDADVYAILSDGYPSGDVDGIYTSLSQNRSASGIDIRVFAVSYQASSAGVSFMKDLAIRFGGSHVRR